MSNKKNIGIVGGGILGMTLALRLAQNGFKVTLLEATERTGGLASPSMIGSYTWDRFYHVILMSDSNLLSLLAELDLADQIQWSKAKTGFFTDGRLYSMSNVFEFLTFPPLKLLDKLRLGWTIFYAAKIKSWERLEKIPVAEWLRRHSGRQTFDKIWLPLLKSKLGENYKNANASFIWAIIARMYAARRSGLKQEMFGYVEGGYARILDRFQNCLDEMKVEILCDTRVAEIQNNGTQVQVLPDSKNDIDFDGLVLTVPCAHIPRLCSQLSVLEKERFNRVRYEGVLCLTLISKKPLDGYYITNITDEWVPFTAVIEMTSIVDSNRFDGNSLIYLPLYLEKDDPFMHKNDEAIEDEFLSALEKMYPLFKRDNIVYSMISRAKHVLPITALNYSTDLLPPTKTSLRNIFIANSAQIVNGTMNVNEIVGHANRKAKEIASYLEA